jgi:hypothetical protein
MKLLTAGKTAKEILMKKIVVLVLVAIFLAGGLVLMSCGDKCPGDGNCSSNGDKWCGLSINSSTNQKEAEKALNCMGGAMNWADGDKSCDC